MEYQAFRQLQYFFVSWYDLPSRKTLSSRVQPLLYDSVREVVRDHFSWLQGRKVHFTVGLWSGGQHCYLSLRAHWGQPEDLSSGRVSVTGLQGEAFALPPGDRSVLLQVRHMETRNGEEHHQ